MRKTRDFYTLTDFIPCWYEKIFKKITGKEIPIKDFFMTYFKISFTYFGEIFAIDSISTLDVLFE